MTEKDLVQKLKLQDRDAFNLLVLAYQQKIINMAYGMLSSKEDALDAAQETFIRIYKNIDTFKGTSSLSTWIYRICTNVCNDILRKRVKTKSVISLDADDEEDSPIQYISDSSPTPEQHAEINERQAAVRRAIEALNDEYRAVIVLYDIEGMSYDEISAVLKCPVGTIKSRLNRARANLKKILSENRELFS